MKKKLISLLLAGVLVMSTACGSTGAASAGDDGAKEAAVADSGQPAEEAGQKEAAQDEEQVSSAETESQEETAEESTGSEEAGEYVPSEEDEASRATMERPDLSARNGDGELVDTFISEPFYDGVIEDEEDARKAVESVYDEIGADESTELKFEEARTVGNDVYYMFSQTSGDIHVQGGMVKLVVDENGQAAGLVSSLLPGLDTEDSDEWMITAEEAEAIVEEYYIDQNIKVLEGMTEQVVLSDLGTGEGSGTYNAWAVYTENFYEDYDQTYLAHYVSEDGEYLYCMPLSTPGSGEVVIQEKSSDDSSGESAGDSSGTPFPFDQMEEDVWTGTITHFDGTQEEITVPVMVDPQSGTVVLGDRERKILCADAAECLYYNYLTVRTSEDWDSNEILTYYNFIQTWDFYDSVGWKGPDSSGSPSLLLMDLVDSTGEPIDNAFYGGKASGFELFAFNCDKYGDCVDVMAHEYTHCVTNTAMGEVLYINEYGAINEAMSDIQGNLIEIMTGGDTDGSWLIGENSGVTARSLAEPHLYDQPGYIWDAYYVPNADRPCESNDNGGVHYNSSLLGVVSYKLYEAGMTQEEQFNYWMNVARSMVPHTDLAQLAQLLPWCMERAGYSQYTDAVAKATEEGGYTRTSLPDTIEEGCGLITFTYNVPSAYKNHDPQIGFVSADSEDVYVTWPERGTNQVTYVIPEGKYYVVLLMNERRGPFNKGELETIRIVASTNGWAITPDALPEEGRDQYVFEVREGDELDLESDSLMAALEAYK